SMEIISYKIQEVMELSRFGIWMFSISRDAIYEELSLSNNQISSGKVLYRKEMPEYFAKADEEKLISLSDKDLDLNNYYHLYTNTSVKSAVLMVPIFSDGEKIGLIHCETNSPGKDWDIHDKNFACSCADFIGRIIESEKRYAYEKELKHRIN